MTPSEAASAIKQRLKSQWAVLHADQHVFWPNEDNEIPDGESFLMAEISFGAVRVASLGGSGVNRHRQTGECIVSICAPVNAGEDDIRTLADDAASIFRGWISGELRFYTAAPQGLGQQDGNLYQIDVIGSFEFDLVA